jgi:hypothetical protein
MNKFVGDGFNLLLSPQGIQKPYGGPRPADPNENSHVFLYTMRYSSILHDLYGEPLYIRARFMKQLI